ADDGAIFISIDDCEQHTLRMVFDEIFGEENFITNIIWQKKYAASNDAKYFSDNHDFIICYAKNKINNGNSIGWVRKLLPRTEKQDSLYKYDSNDGKGLWRPDNLTVKSYSAEYDYPITNPNTEKKYDPTKGRCWLTNKGTMIKWIEEGRVFFGKDGQGAPQLKRYLNEVQSGIVHLTIWLYDEVGHTDSSRKALKVLFQESDTPFDNPKPVELLKRIVQISTNPNDLVMDSFAGSGTTMHAVMDLNKEDGGNPSFGQPAYLQAVR
ncbi:MAG: site-specific DNA-methyltransferase, partial [Bacteroidota bacterium]